MRSLASRHCARLDYAADNAWLPYGLKSDAELRARVPALLARWRAQWAPDAVVRRLQHRLDHRAGAGARGATMPVVGVVPPIKPAAALTRTGVIGLLATPATVRRAYTDDLIAQFAADKRVVRFGSAALVEAAERKLRGRGRRSDGDRRGDRRVLFGAPGGDRDRRRRAGLHAFSVAGGGTRRSRAARVRRGWIPARRSRGAWRKC